MWYLAYKLLDLPHPYLGVEIDRIDAAHRSDDGPRELAYVRTETTREPFVSGVSRRARHSPPQLGEHDNLHTHTRKRRKMANDDMMRSTSEAEQAA